MKIWKGKEKLPVTNIEIYFRIRNVLVQHNMNIRFVKIRAYHVVTVAS